MILFVVGAPAVGKTTLVRRILGKVTLVIEKPKWTIANNGCAAGHYVGGTFDGADMVPYNGAQTCLDFWKERLREQPLTIFDGDRFSNAGVLTWLMNQSMQHIHCIHMVAAPHVLQERRIKRGSTQSESWMKGRETKSSRFAQSFKDGTMLEVVADRSEEALGYQVLKYLEQTGTRVPG